MLAVDPFPVFRRYGLHAGLLWRVAPSLSVLCLVLIVVSAAASAMAWVATGRVVDSVSAAVGAGAGSGAADLAWWWLAVTAAVFVVGPVASSVSIAVGEAIAAQYLVAVSDMTMQLGTDPYGIEHLEEPDRSGRLEAMVQAPRDWLFVTGIAGFWQMVAARLSGIGALAVLMTWSWWAPLIAVVGWLINGRAWAGWTRAIFDEMLHVTGTDRRRARYLQSLLTSGTAGKEVRLFGLVDWLVGRYTTTWRTTMAQVWSRRTAGLRGTLWTTVVVLVANAIVFALLARAAWTGAVSTGSLVTLVQALLALSAFGSLYEEKAVARTTSVLAELTQLRAEQGLPRLFHHHATMCSVPRASAVERPRPAAVDLQEVTFGYPSRDAPTIAGLTLQIPAGQSVALVGANGAGKSTLIKLLCGLHRPESGTVRIDGADPGTDSAARQRVAAIFQDFVQYHLSLRDNIAFGAVACSGDPAVADRALSDAGGAELIKRLHHGWDTVLSAEYAGGTDLSGGQWQRVALGRALAALSTGAGLLVLDEPTAAQDVRVEAALFDRFLHVTRGATTVLVSHRLSSVRRADRIIVLADPAGTGAHIVEDGTHEELLAADGVYAHMFTLQAFRFAAAGGSEVSR